MKKKRLIAVDFDGTIVEHVFPEIGEFLPHAERVLKRLQDAGHKLILNTCREDTIRRSYLTEAVEFCTSNGINLSSINKNDEEDRLDFPNGRKIYAHLHIDDRNWHYEDNPVDWLLIEEWMEKKGWLEKIQENQME